jgi:hypothetical protein
VQNQQACVFLSVTNPFYELLRSFMCVLHHKSPNSVDHMLESSSDSHKQLHPANYFASQEKQALKIGVQHQPTMYELMKFVAIDGTKLRVPSEHLLRTTSLQFLCMASAQAHLSGSLM